MSSSSRYVLFFTLILLPLLGRAAVIGNPLIARSATPFANPGFEENLKGWGGRADDRYRTMPRSPNASVDAGVTPVAWEGKTALLLTSILEKQHKELLKPWGAGQDFQVEKGKRYYISAMVRTEGPIQVSIGAVLGMEAETGWVSSDRQWRRIGFIGLGSRHHRGWGEPANPDPTQSYCQLRILARSTNRGPGKVVVDDIRVEELIEYAPYVRITILSPAAGKYDVALNGEKISALRNGPKDGLAPNTPSAWLKLTEFSWMRGARAIGFGVKVLAWEKPEPLARVKARIDFAYAPRDGACIRSVTRETPGNTIGILAPGPDAPFAEFFTRFCLINDDIRARNRQVKAYGLPAIDFKHFYIEGHVRGYLMPGDFYSDPTLVDIEAETLKTIGFSAMDTRNAGLGGVYRLAAAKQGIRRTHHLGRFWSGNMIEAYDNALKCMRLRWDVIREGLRRNAEYNLSEMRKEDPEQVPLIKFLDIGDEISGGDFGGPEWEQGYRDYLQAQDVTPAELGKANWGEVAPMGRWNWTTSAAARPKDRADRAACANYYWTMRYWNWVTARLFRIDTEEHEKLLPVPTRINFGPPWAYGYCLYLRGAEIWECARQRACSSMWNEDWLPPGALSIQTLAFIADLNRSCAAIHNMPYGAMVIPGGGDNKEIAQLKVASVIGRGVKWIDLYNYGPWYARSDSYSAFPGDVEGVARVLHTLAKANESVLYAGKPPRAEVAIIWSASDALWHDSTASLYNRMVDYLALQHRQISIDFLDEMEVERGRLKEYKYVVLVDQYLRRRAQQALAAWVEQGGRLLVDGLGGLGDEYGQASDLLYPVYGIKSVAITQDSETDFRPPLLCLRTTIGVLSLKTGEKIDAVGARAAFTLTEPENDRVLASWDDGTVGAFEHRYGKGLVRCIGAYAGLNYSRPVVWPLNAIESGYREQERRMLTDFLLQNGVTRPIVSSVPVVQADALYSDKGVGVVLANFTGSPQPTVTITVQVARPVKSVTSAVSGTLPFRRAAAGRAITCTLPLRLVDFLTVK